MRPNPFRLSIIAGCLASILSQSPALQASDTPLMAAGQDLNATRDERMAWFRDAKFGMFIHWGVYSMFEGEYNGADSPRYAEWIWNNARIPAQVYMDKARQFNPVAYDPVEWAKMAQDAGMTYMVITAKHHDGFAMFDTEVSDWGVKDTTWGKDVVAPLKEAANDAGLRFGLYYSQSLDWGNHGDEGGTHWDRAYSPYPAMDRSEWPDRFDQYMNEVALPQVNELTTNYGELDMFWWDMPKNITDSQAQQMADILWGNQPDIVSNGRLSSHRNSVDFGDFDTHEQSIPPVPQLDTYWESCMTMNNTWGYRRSDQDWKSTAELIHNLTGVVSKGGNYLLNIGPKADGSFPKASIDRLQDIGEWMQVNGEAIHGTTATPFLFQQAFRGATTQRVHDDGVTLYLHVYEWPTTGDLQVLGVTNKKLSAYLLSDQEKTPLTIKHDAKGIRISVPEQAPDQYSSTVVLEVEGELELEEVTGVMTADGMVLRSLDADTKGVQYNSWHNSLMDWTDLNGSASWTVDFAEPGRYAVQMFHGNREESHMQLTLGDDTASLIIPASGEVNMRRKYARPGIIGEIVVSKAGEQTLTLTPAAEGFSKINMGELTILPLINALQGPDGNIGMHALSADYGGDAVVYRGARQLLDGVEESLSWETTITRQTGTFDAVATYRSEQPQDITLYVGNKAYPFTLKATGEFPEPLNIHIGQIDLTESGATEVRLETTASGTFDFYGIELYEAGFYATSEEPLATQFPIARSHNNYVDKGQHPLAHFPDKVLDGSNETRWLPAPANPNDIWFEVDYGQPQHIRHITPIIEERLGQREFYNSINLIVTYRDEQGEWQKLTKLPVSEANKGFNADQTARQWRFEFSSDRRGTFSVSQMIMES